MGENALFGFFEDYIFKESIFKERNALQSNYFPETISHREEQVNQVAKVLAPSLRMERPSNLFVYGKTGTGKTLTVKHVSQNLMKVASERKIPLNILYLNCKLRRGADTEYRLIAQLIRELGKEIPVTGLPTDEVYHEFFSILDAERKTTILVLDEVDQLVKKVGDEVLYSLTRVNEELKKSQISLVGISNDLVFMDHVDPRVRSSLSEEELIFPPYNAFQLQDILRHRAEAALRGDSIEPGVIEKCAAYAAREHGDARRALDLFRVAAEITERNSERKITLAHVDFAEDSIERDRVFDVVKSQPKQSQAALYSIIQSATSQEKPKSTGEIYGNYRAIATRVGLRPLTQRRISDILAELDMLGIINTRVLSKGRYGRTTEISLAVAPSLLGKLRSMLEEGLAFS
ncbi:ORC1-type DNA replication protein [Candidatus Woesearchaeota archaeon]|nr:ORC1-type DNA replication protein [Candidatus Woesearchaeota archaeon]